MKLAAFFLFALRVSSLAFPEPESESNRLTQGEVAIYSDSSNTGNSDSLESSHELAPRRGGGGGGGGGGHGGGGRGSSGAGGGGRSSPTSPSSNAGGTTSGGSKKQPAYGGKTFYAGGGRVPYTSGKPASSVVPAAIAAGVIVTLFGLWAFGAFVYDFDDQYRYWDPTKKRDVTLPVKCVCQRYLVCACDKNNNSTYYKDLFGGDVPKNNDVVNITDYKGVRTIFIDGTLENGTTASGASTLSGASITTLVMTAIMVTGMVWFI